MLRYPRSSLALATVGALAAGLSGCAGDPTSRLTGVSLDEPRSALFTVTVRTDRPELNADGSDSAVIRVTVRDAASLPVVNQSLSLHLNQVGYVGPAGVLGRASGLTNEAGELTSTYTAPNMSIVPAGAIVRITAVAGGTTITPAPTGKVDIILLPKGTAAGGGGGGSGGGGSGGGGATPGPLVTSILPAQAPPEAPLEVIVRGQNFDPDAVVIFRGGPLAEPKIVTPALAEPTRIRLMSPALTAAETGVVEVVVAHPGGAESNPVPFTFTQSPPTGPVLASLSPISAPTAGRTALTLNGSNLRGDDTIVFAGATLPGGEITICGPAGPPTCDNKTGLPKAAGCVAGTIGDFRLAGGVRFDLVTQCVGAAGGGTADVFVRRSSGEMSNALTFAYAANPGVLQPVILSIQQESLTLGCPAACPGPTCCSFLGYQFIVVGMNFDPCASLILVHNGVIHEFLPDPLGRHQANAGDRGIACELDPGLPLDCAETRPDLVPYPHDQIVAPGGGTCVPYAPPSLSRGVYFWQDANEIRLLYGPQEDLGCGISDAAKVYVSNKPGTGLVSDGVSAPSTFTFVCQE
jgi:hypothetical protein